MNQEPPAIPNPHYEALLRMREHNPGAWRVLSPNTKLAVLYYEAAKREHARLEAMRNEGSGLPPAA
ncbi:MAG: hypothetical protein H0W99_04755 [Acidobacteria bacterium]|nr:hypothetical protein [Acidobacteriota bacterium]